MHPCVLVAEQNKRVCELIGRELGSNCNVYTVEPDRALEWLDDRHADGLIINLEAPSSVGWEILRVVADPVDGYHDMAIVGMAEFNIWNYFVQAEEIAPHLRFLMKPLSTVQMATIAAELLGDPLRRGMR